MDRVVVDKGVEEKVQIKVLVPNEYYKFLPIFTKVVHNILLLYNIY